MRSPNGYPHHASCGSASRRKAGVAPRAIIWWSRTSWTKRPAFVAACILCGLGLSAAQSAVPAEDKQPNVLLIISDDQGYGDFGFTGNALVQTPVLDRLADESARYDNFVVAPACSPSRAALFTGRNHLLTGVWGIPPRANLRPDEARMPAFFKAAGYRTLHIGKLDCAKMHTSHPTEFGWQDWLGGGAYEQKDPMVFEPGHNRREEGWTVDLWTDRAIERIREKAAEPWFISLAYIIPHLPWLCDEKYRKPFLEAGCSESLADCLGSIAQMDASIGRVLDALRETGQAERTIVVFLSDNGPTSPGVQKKVDADGMVQDEDWAKRNSAGLRGHKATVWESGLRVPLLVRWPGRIPPGPRGQFATVEDILPTLLDLCSIPADIIPHLPFTGVSLAASLQDADQTIERPEAFRLAISFRGAPADQPQGGDRKFEDHHLVLRGPRFKLHSLPGGQVALYDLPDDPGERRDVSADFPDEASRMTATLRAHWDEITSSGRAFAPEPDS